MSNSTLRSSFDGVRIDGDGRFVCKCGFPTRDYRVKKKSSPYYGLQYYACAKHGSDPTQCPSWIWFDEMERVSKSIPPEMRSLRTPRKQKDIRDFGLYTPPSTKRKAETQSFDSGVGDMEGTGEPASPLSSRPAKRTRSANAATQTADGAARPAIRPMPRRRLFDEFLDSPRRSTNDNTNSSAPGESRRKGSLFGASIIGEPSREQPQTRKPASPTRAVEGGPTPSRTLGSRQVSRDRRVHLTPPSSSNHNSNTRIAPLNVDSDTESYGWNDEMVGDIVDLAKNVENPRSSPLFF